MPSRAQAKRRKTGGSTAAPSAPEPAFTKPASPLTHAEPGDIMKDAPDDTYQPSEPAGHDTAAESPARDDPKPPSPSMADEDTALPDVAITGAGHQTPEPRVLSRHSGKAETSSIEEFHFESPVLEKFTADELHAGFLNRLESSRKMELKLVSLMKKKYEVIFLPAFPLYPFIAAKSRINISNNKPGLSLATHFIT